MKQRGFTLIEVMIVVIIIAIVGMVGLGAINGSNSNITYGAMGMTESRCIEGYKFIMDQRGNSRQILDEFGKGVRCEKTSVPGGMK